MLKELNGSLHVWVRPPNSQFLKILDSIHLDVIYLPARWQNESPGYSFGSINYFTLWNLILFGEKLELIKEILIFYRLTNGLLRKQHYLIVREFGHFLAFFAENIDYFK
jgi:hypothetical protein